MREGWSKNFNINGWVWHNGGRVRSKNRGGGSPFQRNFGATTDAQQNFKLENGCLLKMSAEGATKILEEHL